LEIGGQVLEQKCSESQSCKGSTPGSGRSFYGVSFGCSAECGLVIGLEHSGTQVPAKLSGLMPALEHTIPEFEAKVPVM